MNISKEVEGGFLMSKRVYSLYCHVLHTVFYLTRQKRVTKGGGVGWGARGEKGSRVSLGSLTPATPLGWLRCDGLVLKRNDIRAIFKRVS